MPLFASVCAVCAAKNHDLEIESQPAMQCLSPKSYGLDYYKTPSFSSAARIEINSLLQSNNNSLKFIFIAVYYIVVLVHKAHEIYYCQRNRVEKQLKSSTTKQLEQ